MPTERPIIIATRGSALALAQSNMILDQLRGHFPELRFELQIIKTTGDKLQTASLSRVDSALPRGLFTKELEIALLESHADLAVHSLKDLPTELPLGLKLGAVPEREDVRDVLIYRLPNGAPGRGFPPGLSFKDLPPAGVVATSSTRRKAQALALRPDLQVIEIRGNVPTRLEKLAAQPQVDAIILAAAGLARLNFRVNSEGHLQGEGIPAGLAATPIEVDWMLPCVGQGALGIEIREHDGRTAAICEKLNHSFTHQSVLAERAFLSAMGGGCQSPVGAYGEVAHDEIKLRAVSFLEKEVQRGQATAPLGQAVALGKALARQLQTPAKNSSVTK